MLPRKQAAFITIVWAFPKVSYNKMLSEPITRLGMNTSWILRWHDRSTNGLSWTLRNSDKQSKWYDRWTIFREHFVIREIDWREIDEQTVCVLYLYRLNTYSCKNGIPFLLLIDFDSILIFPRSGHFWNKRFPTCRLTVLPIFFAWIRQPFSKYYEVDKTGKFLTKRGLFPASEGYFSTHCRTQK